MNRIVLIVTASALILGAFAYVSATGDERGASPAPMPRTEGSRRINTERFVSRWIVDAAYARALTSDESICDDAHGGMVNHHDLAPELIAEFFVTLKRCRPDIDLFVILSPDHFDQVSTWESPHGDYTYAGQRVIVRPLVYDPAQMAPPQGPNPLEREHGVGILIPFIAKTFPGAWVTPIIINQRTSSDHLDLIGHDLEGWLNATGTFVIVSADMSHYLDEQRAKSSDQLTMSALETGDVTFFLNASDDYTDSGKSIAVVMNALRDAKWTMLSRRISTDFGGSPGYTTSYITGFWSPSSH